MWKPKELVAVVALLLAACDGASGGGNPPAAVVHSGGSAGQALDPDRAAPAEPIDGAVAGGTVTVLTSFWMPTLDPSVAYYVDASSILSGLVVRSLTQYVHDPDSGSMVLVPDLATDLGTPNADFTEWSFTIRDGVRFEDGTPVTADDVAFGIKRSFHPFEDSPPHSKDYFLDGDTYQGPYRSGTDYAGVVVDGDTVTITMARPFPDMPYYAAFPAMGPIPEARSDPDSYGRDPLATGPYKVDSFTPNESLTLVRNPEWDPDTDPGRHAYPDRYLFRFDQKDSDRIDATILGESARGATTLSYDTVSPEHYVRALRQDQVATGPTGCTFMWWPDYRTVPDIRVRKAIQYAWPYEEVASKYGGIYGETLTYGTSLLPPGFPGRQDYNALDIEPGHTDPAKAKALLRQAGYAPGEYELSWPVATSDPDSMAALPIIVKAMEVAGFAPEPFRTASDKALWNVVGDPGAPVNIRPGGWCQDWPSGNAFLAPLLHSDTPYNDAYFDEPEVDAEIERISRLPIEEQHAAWGTLEETIMTDYYPAVITAYPVAAMPYGTRIGGMNNDANGGLPTWKDIHVLQ